MVWKIENHSVASIQSFMQQILATGKLSRRDYMHLTTTILADYHLSDRDRCQINRVLDYVQIGRLKLVD
ncbi:MAG: hypothetical protein MUF72_10190 [Elainella sp. Prado103]|jgi:hypothetical protein|nr:hypothetical protein [Elainella sp. Prado103]